MSKTIDAAYLVSLPNLGSDIPEAFRFITNTDSGTFALGWRWSSKFSQWMMYVTLPTGEIRQAGIFPNDVSWTGFSDYGFFVKSVLPDIGQSDLSNCSFYILKWGVSGG